MSNEQNKDDGFDVDAFLNRETTSPFHLQESDAIIIGKLGVGILSVVLVIDTIGYLVSIFNGTSRSYVPLSVRTWVELDYFFKCHYRTDHEECVRPRSLEPLTGVLDALADAVKKWEEPQNAVRLNARDTSFVFGS